jgi:hypothetical protein
MGMLGRVVGGERGAAVEDPVEFDGPPERVRTLHSVPPPVNTTAETDFAKLADELAAALRAIRGYVPHRIWWEAGPAQALFAYQALRAR